MASGRVPDRLSEFNARFCKAVKLPIVLGIEPDNVPDEDMLHTLSTGQIHPTTNLKQESPSNVDMVVRMQVSIYSRTTLSLLASSYHWQS